jgi:hypothetical protein
MFYNPVLLRPVNFLWVHLFGELIQNVHDNLKYFSLYKKPGSFSRPYPGRIAKFSRNEQIRWFKNKIHNFYTPEVLANLSHFKRFWPDGTQQISCSSLQALSDLSVLRLSIMF